MDEAEQLKAHHARLRLRAATDPVAWEHHLHETEALKEYARNMRHLGTVKWRPDSDSSSRIGWNLKALRAYFREGGEEKAVAKDARRRAFYSTGSADSAAAVSATAPATTDRDAPAAKRSKPGRIVVLDVGASYNPLGRYSDELDVTALDLAPAAEEVLCADFTQATFTDETLPAPTVTSENGVPGSIVLQRRKYDAVVFNLLLSYLPTPELRFACCRNARQALRTNGVLLITTVDSSHDGKGVQWMKDWRAAIESLGFRRCVYEKLPDLRCLAFRAVDPQDAVENALDPIAPSTARLMYILQDKQVAEAQMYFLQGKQVAEVPTKPSSASDQPQSQQQQPSNAVAPVATDGADKSASDTTLDEDVPVSSLSPTDQ